MEKLKITECFIEDRAFKASDCRLYQIFAKDGKLAIKQRLFLKKTATETDAKNREESSFWKIENNQIYLKTQEGLTQVKKQFTIPSRDYKPEPIIAGNLAFCCTNPVFIHSLPYGDWDHSYFILKADGNGGYEDITAQYKTSKYVYIKRVSIYNNIARIVVQVDNIDRDSSCCEIEFVPSIINQREYEVENLVDVTDTFCPEAINLLNKMFAHLL